MEYQTIWSKLNQIALWVSRLAYLNLLWVFFSLIGFIVFGLMPATISMFVIVRKWRENETDFPLFSFFWTIYKQHFKQANLLGGCLYLFTFLLLMNYAYAGQISTQSWYTPFLFLTIIASFLFIILCMYIGPVFTYYRFSFKHYLGYSIHIGLANLLHTIAMLVCLYGVYYLTMKVPGLSLFFSISVSAFIVDHFAQYSFRNVRVADVNQEPT
ncbi:Uncharacterized membrane protein YesL [Amphibacillus marinus]|uniref:Uncharacterized membrane protein YesL n=1 Tax=Amphibacillus marinus TaxID=872970 RepID=A0A1H8HB63_9BACI|nr:DUF624 domain-containing protein [Amphibacillus marinus]SEN53442.1 Uncharacterized membrane protein YesL [Amphibacillus marinus]